MEDTTVELLVGEGCCIECAAKREYNKMVLQIMTADDPPGPFEEFRLELLLDFFEHADFAFLRSSNESFSSIKDAHCFLKRNDEGTPYITVHDL